MCKRLKLAVVASMMVAGLGVANADTLGDRVEEELLSDGISLARLNQRLELREQGTAIQVVLVDRTTGAVVATRAVETLPSGPAPAIAQLTVIVSTLLRERGLVPASASAGSWTTTFAPAAIAAHHRPASIAVVAVTRPGRLGAETSAAAAALVAAYRAAGVANVKDGAALGAVLDADDAAIARRASVLAVENIAVLRVFLEEPRPRAVVTIYDAQGQLVTGFSAVAGQAVAAPPGRDSVATAPVQVEKPVAAPASAAASEPAEPSLDEAGMVRLWVKQRDPELQLLMTNVAPITGGNVVGQMVTSSIVCRAPCGIVVDGSQGEPFTFGELGEPRTRQFNFLRHKGDVTADVKLANRGLIIGGQTLVGVGLVTLVGGIIFAATSTDEYPQGFGDYNVAAAIAGGLATAGGGYMWWAGFPSVDLAPGRPTP